MALGKEELLAAIAAAGSAGRQAYDQANQQIAQQQQAAVQQAMMGAANAPEEARAQLSGIISQPYQQRTAQITQNRATMDDWYNRQSTMQNTYLDQALRLAELRAAELAAGGSGGGGGGGGGGSGDGEFDWDKNLATLFGTREAGFDAIENEAKTLGLNSVQNPDLPRYMQTRALATDKYGVPEDVAATEFLPSSYAYTGKKPNADFSNLQDLGIMERAQLVGNKKGFKKFKQDARAIARQTPGNQSYWTGQAIRSAKKRVPKKKK